MRAICVCLPRRLRPSVRQTVSHDHWRAHGHGDAHVGECHVLARLDPVRQQSVRVHLPRHDHDCENAHGK